MRKLLKLTPEQMAALAPIFEQVQANNEKGIVSAIGAQIHNDGLNVKLFSGDEATSLAEALGAKGKTAYFSAGEQYETGCGADRLPATDTIFELPRVLH